MISSGLNEKHLIAALLRKMLCIWQVDDKAELVCRYFVHDVIQLFKEKWS